MKFHLEVLLKKECMMSPATFGTTAEGEFPFSAPLKRPRPTAKTSSKTANKLDSISHIFSVFETL